MKSDLRNLRALGSRTKTPKKVSITLLETFSSPSKEHYYVTFEQKGEFTSLCPITGQPDFGDISIVYRPSNLCMESKSLKLYLASYRQTGSFGEALTNRIADDLFAVLRPEFLAVKGNFKPRGGIGWATTAIRGREDYTLTFIDELQIAKFL